MFETIQMSDHIQVSQKRRFLDEETGNPVDVVELSEGEYEKVHVRHLDPSHIACVFESESGKTETLEFKLLDEMYRGVEPLDGDRRDVPADIQDVLQSVGYTAVTKFRDVQNGGSADV